MAVKTANFNMRMEEQKKADAEALYRTLGMTLPQAINMFISQSLLVGGIPFDVRIPRFNQETEAAMKEAGRYCCRKDRSKILSFCRRVICGA